MHDSLPDSRSYKANKEDASQYTFKQKQNLVHDLAAIEAKYETRRQGQSMRSKDNAENSFNRNKPEPSC